MRKTVRVAIILSLLVSVLAGGARLSGMLDRLEWMSFDWRMRVYNQDKTADPRVVIILIDEASLQYMNDNVGRWPWPRDVHASLIDFLSNGNPRAVLFDILFVENQLDSATQKGALSAPDQSLVDASANAEVVFHAMQLRHEMPDESHVHGLNPLLPPDFAGRFSLADGFPDVSKERQRHAANNEYEIPFPALYEAATGVGVVSAEPDEDGIFRRMKLLHEYQGSLFPALSLAALIGDKKNLQPHMKDQTLLLGDMQLPVDEDGNYLVNLYNHFENYSYSALISSYKKIAQGEIEDLPVDPAVFEDKIVFIGSNAVGVEDLKATALSNKVAGVNLHASIVSNILNQDYLRTVGPIPHYMLIILLAILTSFGVLVSSYLGIRWVVPALLLVGYNLSAYLLFSQNLVIDMIVPSLSIVLAATGAFLFLYFTEGQDKKRVRKVLSQYVSPAVLAEVVDKFEDHLRAEVGSRENLTILFSDIRGFTSLSETMDGARVVSMLNIYFSDMTDAIFRFDGTIDKFIGDAIMAFWGAPIRSPDHADKAVMAALEMLSRLSDVNRRLQADGYPALEIGIGLNSGEVILGNIGSDRKLDYTIIGDNVNLASRLEGLTKQYGCPVLLSEYTYQQMSGTIPCRVVDLVRVKGKHHPIRLYAPVLPAQVPAAARATDIVSLSEQAFTSYLQRRWQEAIDAYMQLPDDLIRHIMVERCLACQKQEPGPEWDGVFTMKTK